MGQELRLEVARYVFGYLGTKEIQAVIERLLEEDIYVDEFLDVIYPEAATFEIVGPAFERAMEALGLAVPSYEDAVWSILRHHISRIADGKAGPLDELGVIMSNVYWRYDFHSKASKYIGDSHGVGRLIGLYWEYDDYRRDTDDFESLILAEAKQWVERYGAEDAR